MNERLPDYSPRREGIRTAPPYGPAPTIERRHDPQPYMPPPDASSWLRPIAFLGALVIIVVVALSLLFWSGDPPSDEVSTEELAALLAEPPEPSDLPPLWATPTRPSDLEIGTTPAGASVRLNDEWVGFTPVRLDQNPPGYYTLSLTAPDHSPKDTSFYLASGSFLRLDVRLDPLAPPPPVASASPPEAAAPARRHIQQQGQPAGGGTPPAEAPEFEVVSPEEVRRASHTGSLSVTSNPPGAIVLVDGVPFGRAPLSLSELRPGSYVVTVTLPGHVPLSYQAEVAAQSVAVVKAVFPPDA